MTKILITIMGIMLLLPEEGLSKTGNFIAGFEVGPNVVYVESLPKEILPSELGYSDGDIASFLFLFGYRFKGIKLTSRAVLGGSSRVGESERDPYNVIVINLSSLNASTRFLKFKRIVIDGTLGYQYTHFNSFPSNKEHENFKYTDTGVNIGLKTRFNFIENDSRSYCYYFVGILNEYTMTDHPLKRLTFFAGMEAAKGGEVSIKFNIFKQKNMYRLYTLTIGFWWYFSF